MLRTVKMKDEILKLAFTSFCSFSLGAGTFAYSVSAKASKWESDKPYIAEALTELKSDVKALLGKMSAIEQAVNGPRASSQGR